MIKTTSGNPEKHWQPLPLIILHIAALALLGSWWFEGSPTRQLWDSLDRIIFYWLNGSLESGPLWQQFWAATNVRAFDLVPAVLFLAMYIHFALADHRRHLRERTALFLFLSLFALIVIDLAKMLIGLDRHSPSLILQPVYLFSELVPGTVAKEESDFSFPGDHASFLFLWTGFLWYYGNRHYGLSALVLALLFSLPRLVGGAHWLTDDLVGGGVTAIIGLSWLFYSPLNRIGPKLLMPIIKPVFSALEYLRRRL